MKQVKVIDIVGQSYDLLFEYDITINLIHEKLLKEYHYYTYNCIFYRSGVILDDQTILKQKFNLYTLKEPIIIINSKILHKKSDKNLGSTPLHVAARNNANWHNIRALLIIDNKPNICNEFNACRKYEDNDIIE